MRYARSCSDFGDIASIDKEHLITLRHGAVPDREHEDEYGRLPILRVHVFYGGALHTWD